MPIAVACQCGRRFSAKDELSGRTVACPACKRPLAIPSAGVVRAKPVTASVPAAAVPARAVVVSCRCGQRFQAAAHLFGKTLNCPSCRAPLSIPNGPMKQPVAATPVDPLMGSFGTTQPDNDPFGLGMIPSTPQTFPSAGLPPYASYGRPTSAVIAPVKKKKKSTGKSGTFWAITGSGIGTAVIVVLVLLRVAGTVARSMRAGGVFNAGFSGTVEWVPYTSQQGGYAVDIVKQKPGVAIPGLAGNVGLNGIVSAMSVAGPCTVVNSEQLPVSLSDAEIALALTAWETQVQGMIKSASVRITHSVKCSIAGHPGHELMFEQTENRTTTLACFKAFFVNDRAYTLLFLATKQVYQQAHADHFFNSFRLLGNAGPSQPAASGPVPTSLPSAVFTLSPPRVPSSNWQGDDIKEMDPGMLFALSK